MAEGSKTWPGDPEPMSVVWDWDWVNGWSRVPNPKYLEELLKLRGDLESRIKKLEEALHGKSSDGQDPPEGQR